MSMRMTMGALRPVALAAGLFLVGSGEAAAWCVRGVASWDTLRVRAEPSPRAPAIGGIPSGACSVAVVGPCRGSWCRVLWRGRVGWSNASYLVRGRDVAGRRAQASTPARVGRVARVAPRVAPPAAPVAARGAVVAPMPKAPRPVAEPPRPTTSSIATSALPEAALPEAPPPVPREPAAEAAAGPKPVLVPLAPAAPPANAGDDAKPVKAGDRQACIVDVEKGDTLKVRAGPGPNQVLRFGFPAGACGVRIAGECVAGWCRVDYRGYSGWAEQRFLK